MFRTIKQASNSLKNGDIEAIDLYKQCLSRALETRVLNAFVAFSDEQGHDQSVKSTFRHHHGKAKGDLDGITFAVKDNFCTEGIKTTCGSKILENFIPPYNATVVNRLLDAGAVLLGKCNLDEFAMGSGTVDSIHGATMNIWGSPIKYLVDGKEERNVHQEWRITGGSSGGCAVAVATSSCFLAIGSDSGGSTRNPASYCGVVGFKPTYSTVSRHGLIPLVNSMDVPGILTRSVEDAAIVFNVICGHDLKDSTTVPDVNKVQLIDDYDISNVNIGIATEFFCEGISESMLSASGKAIQILEEGGARLMPVSLPHTEYSIACYSVLNQCEVASNMARYDGLRYGHRGSDVTSTNKLYAETRSEGFNQVVRSRILAGNYFLLQRNYSEYFEKAMKVRRLICEDFKKAWREVDILITPTTLTEAPLLDEYIKLDNREQCSRHDFCTQPVNMAGCPAISLPVELSRNGLPLSVQLIAQNYNEQILLSVADWLEKRLSFPKLEVLV